LCVVILTPRSVVPGFQEGKKRRLYEEHSSYRSIRAAASPSTSARLSIQLTRLCQLAPPRFGNRGLVFCTVVQPFIIFWAFAVCLWKRTNKFQAGHGISESKRQRRYMKDSIC